MPGFFALGVFGIFAVWGERRISGWEWMAARKM
jgi:hypothetical protein